MSKILVIAAAIISMSTSAAIADSQKFEVNVKLPNGSYQRMIIAADTPANAKSMVEAQYCSEKKNCVVSGPHLAH